MYLLQQITNQGIGQSQSSNQKSGVASGGDTVLSGNNLNAQNQNNTGNNAAAKVVVAEKVVVTQPTKV